MRKPSPKNLLLEAAELYASGSHVAACILSAAAVEIHLTRLHRRHVGECCECDLLHLIDCLHESGRLKDAAASRAYTIAEICGELGEHGAHAETAAEVIELAASIVGRCKGVSTSRLQAAL